MAGYFVLILGTVAFALHVPGLIAPTPHRRLGLRFIRRPSNLRLIGLAMVAIGVGAIFVSPNDGAVRWLLLVLGAYQILSGLFLLGFPDKFASKMQAIMSGPLKRWVGRAVVKCVVALALLTWGLMMILG